MQLDWDVSQHLTEISHYIWLRYLTAPNTWLRHLTIPARYLTPPDWDISLHLTEIPHNTQYLTETPHATWLRHLTSPDEIPRNTQYLTETPHATYPRHLTSPDTWTRHLTTPDWDVSHTCLGLRHLAVTVRSDFSSDYNGTRVIIMHMVSGFLPGWEIIRLYICSDFMFG